MRLNLASTREAEAHGARNEWLASLAALAAGAAHELGTPLGTIALASKEVELAAGRLQDAGVLEDAQLIRSQVERCRRILDRLTALDQDGLGPVRALVPWGHVLAELREDPALAAGLTLDQGALREEEALVPPDLALALQPLLKNALDASQAASLRVEQASAGWTFCVEDSGPGMSPETAARALEPFFTTKEHGRGMGLGLYTARLIAERHGGSLRLDSSVGTGTRVTLELPQPA